MRRWGITVDARNHTTVLAHHLEISPSGALVFWMVDGPDRFVVDSFAPGTWKAVTLMGRPPELL